MAGNPLASLFVKLGLDPGDFSKGIDAANAKADSLGKKGVTTGQLFNAGMVTIGAGLGAVTVAGAQAERAQGEFMAATGASRDEAEKFVSSMDGLAGTTGTIGKSFADISGAGSLIAQQMHLSGDELTDVTSKVLTFSKATKTDVTAAITGLDDAMDSWNLTADQTGDVMDVVTAGVQEFGGTASDSLGLLNALAPSLQAANMEWDDAAGVINLFNRAGVDANVTATAFSKALQKVESPEELEQLIKDIAATEDPFERAQLAAETFGAKAGPKLALALADSGGDLTAFKIGIDEARGATDKAGEAMLTTGDKIKGLADKFAAGAREIGQKFGPALTGAASAASLSAPLLKPFAKLGKPAAEAFAGAFKSRIGSVLTIGSSVATTFASKLTAPIGAALSGVFAKLATNSAVMGSIDRVGGVMGGRLGTALKGAAALGLAGLAIEMLPALMAEWDKIRIKLEDIGHATSETAGKSTEEILAAVANLRKVPEGFDPLKRGIFELSAALPFALGDAKNTWGRSLAELEGELKSRGVDVDAALAGYATGAAATVDAHATLTPDAIDRANGATTDALDDGAAAIDTAFEKYVTELDDGSQEVVQAGLTIASFDPDTSSWDLGPDIAAAGAETQTAIAGWVEKQNAAVADAGGSLTDKLEAIRQGVADKLSGIQDAFNIGTDTKKKKNISGTKRLQQMADDIDQITQRMHESIKANDPVNTAYWQSALIDATNKYNTAKNSINVDSNQIEAEVAAATQGAGQDLTQLGTKATSAAATINQAGQAVNLHPAVTNVQSSADAMRESMSQAGHSAQTVAPTLRSYVPVIGNAADAIANAASNPLDNLNGRSWGEHLATTFVAGMRIGNHTVSSAAAHWANLLSNKLGFSAPPPEGPLHDVPHWGPHMIESWLKPMSRHGRVRVSQVSSELAARFARLNDIDGPHPVGHDVDALPWHRRHGRPGSSSNPGPGADSSDSGGDVYHITVNGNIYGQGGIKQLASDLDRYRRRSKRGGDRYVGAF